MLWGKTINPALHIVGPTPFTVGKPKPETVPADIAAAIAKLVDMERREFGLHDAPISVQAQAERNAVSAYLALETVILKHLRGEA